MASVVIVAAVVLIVTARGRVKPRDRRGDLGAGRAPSGRHRAGSARLTGASAVAGDSASTVRATRRAQTIVVIIGLTPIAVGNSEASPTYRPRIVASRPDRAPARPNAAPRVARVVVRRTAGPRRAHLVGRGHRAAVRPEVEVAQARLVGGERAGVARNRASQLNQAGGVPTATIRREPPSQAIRAHVARPILERAPVLGRDGVVDPRPPGTRDADPARADGRR